MTQPPKRFLYIRADSIPHVDQRYPTVGDWQTRPSFPGSTTDILQIRVSRMPNSIHEYPLIIHELVEALLCHAQGISDVAVDGWDFAHRDDLDPGSDPRCPYHAQHTAATDLEYRMAEHLGLSAEEYNSALQHLDAGPQPVWPAGPRPDESED